MEEPNPDIKEPERTNEGSGIERLMTSDEVAEILHVEPVTIRRLINRGELSAYRIGADYRIAPSDLKVYLQRQRVEATAEAEIGNDLFSQFIVWLRNVMQEKQTEPAMFSGKEQHRFDRFTERARRVLNYSQEEARALQHNYIGTEHLVLGLLREPEGIAGRVLTQMGVTLEKMQQAVVIITGRGDRDKAAEGMVGLTPRAKRTIELAVEEARRMKHHYIGTEHLLLGIMREGEGIGAGVLLRLGVTLAKAREDVVRLLQENSLTEAAETAASAEKEREEVTRKMDEAVGKPTEGMEAQEAAEDAEEQKPLEPPSSEESA